MIRQALSDALRILGQTGLICSGFLMAFLYIEIGTRPALLIGPFAVLSVVALIGSECL